MPIGFQDIKVSIVLLLSDRLPYGQDAWTVCLNAAVEQDHPSIEVLVVDDRGQDALLDVELSDIEHSDRIRHLPGSYENRAAAYNAAVRAASGDFLLLVFNDLAQVVLRRSAVRTMVMAAARDPSCSLGVDAPATGSMVYADYALLDADGILQDIHLLDWHEGRLRDTMDFGLAILYSTATLRELGGLNEEYEVADLYDLRLRVTEKCAPLHVANRFAGSLYSVAASAKAHNVFDYLLADGDSQLEFEDALTGHLKRTGAYLAPGAHVKPVVCNADGQDGQCRVESGVSGMPTQTAGCLASVVIPVNNRPEFIGRAIESVQCQTVRDVEAIVVVNGGPEDPTADVVRHYLVGGDRYNSCVPPVRLIVVDVNNLGLCLNTGIAAARGKYYVQLDSDDRLKPHAVEKLLKIFEADPTVGMVIGSYEVWDLDEETGELTRSRDVPVVTHDEWTADNGRNNLLRINGAGAPRAAYIKVIREVGWFGVNESPCCRNYGEDYDLVLRIGERYTIGRVWEPIYDVIRHAGGTDHRIDQATVDRNDNAKDHMRLEAIQRRRHLNARPTK